MDFDLVCFGELLWDIYEDGEEKMGGAPFNVAAIASLKGVKTAMITAVGSDERGRSIRAAASKKVHLLCQTNEHRTGTVTVIRDEGGTPTFLIEENVAYDYITFNDTIKNVCSGAKFLCFGTLVQRNNVSRETLKKILKITHAVKIYDFNYRDGIDRWQSLCKESIKQTDILKVNEEELSLLKALYGNDRSDEVFVNTLIRQHGLQYVFVTRGGNGASLFSEKKVLHKNALKTEVVDTTGCGDAFTAGIVYSLVNNFDGEKTLECAVRLAAKIAAVKGAVPDNPEYVATL
jgi:fructokinase